jgi:hypothetical protein
MKKYETPMSYREILEYAKDSMAKELKKMSAEPKEPKIRATFIETAKGFIKIPITREEEDTCKDS